MHNERHTPPEPCTVHFSIEKIREAMVDIGNVCAGSVHIGFSFN